MMSSAAGPTVSSSRTPPLSSVTATRSPVGLGVNTTNSGGSSTGAWPTQRRGLLILTQSCWPLRWEYWASDGWLGTCWAVVIQCSRWSSVRFGPQPREDEPKMPRARRWAGELGLRGMVRILGLSEIVVVVDCLVACSLQIWGVMEAIGEI